MKLEISVGGGVSGNGAGGDEVLGRTKRGLPRGRLTTGTRSAEGEHRDEEEDEEEPESESDRGSCSDHSINKLEGTQLTPTSQEHNKKCGLKPHWHTACKTARAKTATEKKHMNTAYRML